MFANRNPRIDFFLYELALFLNLVIIALEGYQVSDAIQECEYFVGFNYMVAYVVFSVDIYTDGIGGIGPFILLICVRYFLITKFPVLIDKFFFRLQVVHSTG